jgi:uncharacterized membrane protein
MQNLLIERPEAEAFAVSGDAGVQTNGHYAPPPEDSDGKRWVRTSALIQADAQSLYELWRDVEGAPRWQEQIVSVVRKDERISHWIMQAGEDTTEWDSEILAEEPGRRIAWRSIGGESDNAGEVIFGRPPGGQGTIVTVLQEFRLGALANLWETFTGRNPKQSIVENLRHFKALAETGEIPRSGAQPHGDRGFIGERKRSLYGEHIPVPPAGTEISHS